MSKSKAKQALEFAKRLASTADNWIDLHNALFGIGGKCVELFPSDADRVAFCKTPEHGEVLRLITEVRQKHGDKARNVAELAANANGKLTIRVPNAIHAALLAEADAEGVSLNQLCLAKLVAQLRAVV